MNERMRKIVQIATTVIDERTETLYALCDDGSLWQMFRTDDMGWKRGWERLADIPQPSPDPQFNDAAF